MLKKAADILDFKNPIDMKGITLWEYAHTGYGHISDEAASYIKDFAKDQGVLLDLCIQGKHFMEL